jgi:hypothetical protein
MLAGIPARPHNCTASGLWERLFSYPAFASTLSLRRIPLFSNWRQEKATTALVDEAVALSVKLEGAKPHMLESHAAHAQFWAGSHFSNGLDLYDMIDWKAADVTRFAKAAETKIAALRKQRAYDSSDGLAIWLHTARAITEPRIAPAVRDIWRQILAAGPNSNAMASDLLHDADLPLNDSRRWPKGFAGEG